MMKLKTCVNMQTRSGCSCWGAADKNPWIEFNVNRFPQIQIQGIPNYLWWNGLEKSYRPTSWTVGKVSLAFTCKLVMTKIQKQSRNKESGISVVLPCLNKWSSFPSRHVTNLSVIYAIYLIYAFDNIDLS